jgi:hypothetical protein
MKNDQVIKENKEDILERVLSNIEKVQAFNLMQEDYIDFKEITNTSDALVTLYELTRTKDAHILLGYTMDDMLNAISTDIKAILEDTYKSDKKVA